MKNKHLADHANVIEVGSGATNSSDASERQFNFTLTCSYTNPWASLTDAEEE